MPHVNDESWRVLWIPRKSIPGDDSAKQTLPEMCATQADVHTDAEEKEAVKENSSVPLSTNGLQLRKASTYLDISIALTLISIVVAFAISIVSGRSVSP